MADHEASCDFFEPRNRQIIRRRNHCIFPCARACVLGCENLVCATSQGGSVYLAGGE